MNETAEELLTKSGYRLSAPRALVLSFLKKSCQPFSAQEIGKEIKSINLVSVYRTLHILEEVGIVNCETIGTE